MQFRGSVVTAIVLVWCVLPDVNFSRKFSAPICVTLCFTGQEMTRETAKVSRHTIVALHAIPEAFTNACNRAIQEQDSFPSQHQAVWQFSKYCFKVRILRSLSV
eukprot:5675578-Amphidinium_carterae.1